MIKILSIIVLISASLFAQNFDEFLNNAIKNSPYLKSSALSISQAQEQGSALTRYENPSLELEYSQFQPASGKDNNGYRAAYSQPIRLWGVGSDKKSFSDKIIQSANAKHALNKAQFIRDISLLYTSYANQKKFLFLADKELEIAQHIYEISKARNSAGTISKGVLLQAQVDYEMVKIKINSLKLETLEQYFTLLKSAGLHREIELDFRHEFNLQIVTNEALSPDILYFESKQKEAVADSRLSSNKIEYIDLMAEYENEPEQDIFRIGAAIPLAFFNKKSQEKQIAKLEANKRELLINGENSKLKIESLRLEKQRNLLELLKRQNQETLKTQVTLLKMFEDAYKIANINLLELQNIKNRVINTKESLIKISTALNQNAIYTNYIAGAYNE